MQVTMADLNKRANALINQVAESGEVITAYTAKVCHPFHAKAATQTAATLPPVGA